MKKPKNPDKYKISGFSETFSSKGSINLAPTSNMKYRLSATKKGRRYSAKTAVIVYLTWDEDVWVFGTSSQYPLLENMPGGVEKQRE
ncbi:MAG: hypothetical protein RIA69_08025 [Cyclobacteriaceae bacterium]